MNKIYIIGNVVHTPDVRQTKKGDAVCSFSVAVKRRFKNPATGDYDTDFFDRQIQTDNVACLHILRTLLRTKVTTLRK